MYMPPSYPNIGSCNPSTGQLSEVKKETGVTVLKHEIDTGGIVRQKSIPIENNDDFGSLYTKLKILGAIKTDDSPQRHRRRKAHYLPQNDAMACHAPKIFHETCQIDFNTTALDVQNFVRGLHPFPGAWFEFMGQEMKVLRCDILHDQHQYMPGSIHSDKKVPAYCYPRRILVLQKSEIRGKERNGNNGLSQWLPLAWMKSAEKARLLMYLPSDLPAILLGNIIGRLWVSVNTCSKF